MQHVTRKCAEKPVVVAPGYLSYQKHVHVGTLVDGIIKARRTRVLDFGGNYRKSKVPGSSAVRMRHLFLPLNPVPGGLVAVGKTSV